jgi:isoquinoline 1-oxidoreductase
MAPLMANAAAAAREMLIDRAATVLGVERSTLEAKDGAVGAKGGGSIAYGELTKGQALVGTIPAKPAVETRAQWRVRGTTVKKIDGRDFVTGKHRYASDTVRPGMVYGRIVRPDSIGATLVSADDQKARSMPNVTVVRDGDFIGVVAPTERVAIRAANSIQATWKPLDGQPSSETIYDHLRKTADTSQSMAVGSHDVPAGAREFKASYRIPYIAHIALEPRAAVAEWSDGGLTVWTATQRPWGVRGELADAFHVPEDKVRVIVPDMGSGYGGKHTGECAIEAARLAKAAGRPVKLAWTRAEEFMWAYFRPAGVIDVRSAVDANGRIVLWEFDNINSGPAGVETPYDIPVRQTLHHPAKTPLRQGSYRALAATANNYVREMHMDEMARALKVDPVEFRMQHLKDDRLRAVLKAAAEKAGWPKPSQPGRAIGIACGHEKLGYVATVAELSKTQTGYNVERLVTAFECGAIINPDGLQNQVEGELVQALGGATFEAIDFGDGRIRNGSLEQYRVPRFKDVPSLETILLDRQDLQPVGAGECAMIGVAPAIGSAARTWGPVDTALPVRFAPVNG